MLDPKDRLIDDKEFNEFMKAVQLGRKEACTLKYLHMSEEAARLICAGIDIGSEHFHWVETGPNVFMLEER